MATVTAVQGSGEDVRLTCTPSDENVNVLLVWSTDAPTDINLDIYCVDDFCHTIVIPSDCVGGNIQATYTCSVKGDYDLLVTPVDIDIIVQDSMLLL